jgi:hypothetical protein
MAFKLEHTVIWQGIRDHKVVYVCQHALVGKEAPPEARKELPLKLLSHMRYRAFRRNSFQAVKSILQDLNSHVVVAMAMCDKDVRKFLVWDEIFDPSCEVLCLLDGDGRIDKHGGVLAMNQCA